MKKKTQRDIKNTKNIFGHSLPYNEPNMIFNEKLLIYKGEKHIKHTCNKNLDL